MLRWRLLTSAIIISMTLAIMWLDFNRNFERPGFWLGPLLWLIVFLGTGEMLSMLAAQQVRPVPWTVYLGTMAVIILACVPVYWKDYPPDCPFGRLGWPMLGLALGVGLAFTGEMLRFKEPGGVIINVAAAVLTMCYVGLLMSFLVPLRVMHDNAWGLAALISVPTIVKLSDTGAYAVGRMFGRTKLSPRLSPGKTVEGVIGGLVAACLASWAYFQFLAPWIVGANANIPPIWASILYGLILALAGMMGDLAESLIKRDCGRKDSSSWMPGLGGTLDVFDSVMVAAPAAYVCWSIGLVGPPGH